MNEAWEKARFERANQILGSIHMPQKGAGQRAWREDVFGQVLEILDRELPRPLRGRQRVQTFAEWHAKKLARDAAYRAKKRAS